MSFTFCAHQHTSCFQTTERIKMQCTKIEFTKHVYGDQISSKMGGARGIYGEKINEYRDLRKT
jgi:hypothetical protein